MPEACDVTGWPDFNNYKNGKGSTLSFLTTSSKPLEESVVKSLLAPHATNNPCKAVPFAFSWRYVGGSGHMKVATGYKITTDGKLTLEVNNPLEIDKGATEEIVYSDYVESPGEYTHWNDYYDFK
jgi:hypothetical protein